MMRTTPRLRVTIIGAGALGSLLGGRLVDAGHRVTLYLRRPEQVAAFRAAGLTIEECDGRVTVRPVVATTEPGEALGADYYVVLVKATDTRTALAPFAGRLEPGALVLTLQNGLGNESAIGAALGDEIPLALGTTTMGALALDPGRVRHTGPGRTMIGYPDRAPDEHLAGVAAALTAAGWPTETTARIGEAIRAKLLINATINPLAALTGLPNGRLLTAPGLPDVMRALLAEAVAVLRAESAATGAGGQGALEPAAAFQRVRAACAATATNRASMLQDLDAGRRTEIDVINGALVALGGHYGIDTPLNAALVALIRGRERATSDERRATNS